MKIMVCQGGLNTGPYTFEEAEALLAAGILEGSDPAWYEGSDKQMPLQDMLSQFKTGPAITLNTTRPVAPAASQPKLTSPLSAQPGLTSPLTTKAKARTTSPISRAKPNPLASPGRPAASTAPEPKAPEMSQTVIICVLGGGLLMLILIVFIVWDPSAVTNLLEPAIKSGLFPSSPTPR
jgi:hypothetical protein